MNNVIVNKIKLVKYYCTNAIRNLEIAEDKFKNINTGFYDILLSELSYYIESIKYIRDNLADLVHKRYINRELIDEILRITMEHLKEVKIQEPFTTDLVSVVMSDLISCKSCLEDLK